MIHTPALLDFVAAWEGLRLNAYLDGGGVPTIGYGHTRGVHPGDTCDEEQALRWLKSELVTCESELADYMHRQPTQQQFDAFVAIGYNCGIVGKDKIGESGLMARFNAKLDQECADRFLLWNRDGGVVIPGLSHRRAAERAIYLFNDYAGRP